VEGEREMKDGKINCVISVSKEKALRQIEDIKDKLIELNDLIQRVNDTEIVINVSVTRDDKKWYQFWK
jgi:hypothetical protein